MLPAVGDIKSGSLWGAVVLTSSLINKINKATVYIAWRIYNYCATWLPAVVQEMSLPSSPREEKRSKDGRTWESEREAEIRPAQPCNPRSTSYPSHPLLLPAATHYFRLWWNIFLVCANQKPFPRLHPQENLAWRLANYPGPPTSEGSRRLESRVREVSRTFSIERLP